jgi:hypothetical protein
LDLLRRFWSGLNVDVTAIEAYEELPAFFLAMRSEILRLQGRTIADVGSRALRGSVVHSLWEWSGVREWRSRLQDAVVAAKDVAPSVKGDRSLKAGFFGIESTGYLVHLASSAVRRSHGRLPKRRLLAADAFPWGAAGYCYAAGVAIASSSSGGAFDRNVPIQELLKWQSERAAQRRLPPAAVLCVPAWVRFARRLIPVGVLYFASDRASAFESRSDDDELRSVLQLTFAGMVSPSRSIERGVA